MNSLSGVSLRFEHLQSYLRRQSHFSALEVVFENYLYTSGERRRALLDLSRDYRVHLHGVSTNIGSTDRLDVAQLKKVRELARQTEAFLISDHLCFTRIGKKSTFELLPVPLTTKMIRHVGERLDKIRDSLKQDFLLENISSYFTYQLDEMDEATFMTELHKSYGANFLLDVNNIYVNSENFGFSPTDFIQRIPDTAVGAYHVAGHEEVRGFKFDTHGAPIPDTVKDLYQFAVRRFGQKPTFLERDENIPVDLSLLTRELRNVIGDKTHEA